jgi:hypothetical protein
MQYLEHDTSMEVRTTRCVLMEAMTENEAHLEAAEEGFNVIAVIQ